MVYAELEPFGPPAEFWRAGLITSMLANIHRKKKTDQFTPEDFMPKGMVNKARTEQTPEQMLAFLKSITPNQKGAPRRG